MLGYVFSMKQEITAEGETARELINFESALLLVELVPTNGVHQERKKIYTYLHE